MIFPRRIGAIALWLALLFAQAALCEAEEADVYIPGWSSRMWSDLKGSVITSNDDTAVYTVFCGNPPNCNLDAEYPLIFTEGPETLIFHGTLSSTFIANLECELTGTTEASCSGYQSCASGYTAGVCTGPDEITWTSTFTEDEIYWNNLPLTTTVENEVSLEVTASAMDNSVTPIDPQDLIATYPSSDSIFPIETGGTGTSGASSGPQWTMAAVLVPVTLFGIVL